MLDIVSDILVALATITAAVIAAVITARYALKLHHAQALTTLRVGVYQDYPEAVQDHLYKEVSHRKFAEGQTAVNLFRCNYRLQVAASDDVSEAANQLVRTLLRAEGKMNGKVAETVLNDVIYAMRQEIGDSQMSKSDWQSAQTSIFSQ